MRILGLTISRNPEASVSGVLKNHRDSIQRLEIEVRELRDQLSQLQGHHLKLRKQFDGSKGGRPASQSGQLPLDQVPFGDKARLRAALGVVPGSRFNHQE